jgi:hypothetical protein
VIRPFWSFQDLVETPSIRLVSHLELLGTQPAEMTVAPRSIVDGIDLVGHVGDRQLPILEDLFLDAAMSRYSAEATKPVANKYHAARS